MIELIKEKYGYHCSAININSKIPKINVPTRKMKFCEAVKYSFDVPIQLSEKNLFCPGARRSMGYNNNDTLLAETISGENNIPASFVVEALNEVPVINQKAKQINLGLTSKMESLYKPEVYILYVEPNKVTELMRLLSPHKMQVAISTNTFLSVCGNVFVNSYMNGLISVSFGCPESRANGGVKDSEVVVGIPARYLDLILDKTH